MHQALPPHDLSPPAFAEGLDDWSRGLGTPEEPTYEGSAMARIARADPDFGDCLELIKTEPVQRLRYRGEVPIRPGRFLAVEARLKLVRGPLPVARIGALAGGAGGVPLAGRPTGGPLVPLLEPPRILALAAVIGPRAEAGVDMVWDADVLYAHVGIDLVGPTGSVVRVESVRITDVTEAFGSVPAHPGFETLPGV
jgi:hypothetical protein